MIDQWFTTFLACLAVVIAFVINAMVERAKARADVREIELRIAIKETEQKIADRKAVPAGSLRRARGKFCPTCGTPYLNEKCATCARFAHHYCGGAVIDAVRWLPVGYLAGVPTSATVAGKQKQLA